MERETGFEPATSTLARSHSTTELFPLCSPVTYHTQTPQSSSQLRLAQHIGGFFGPGGIDVKARPPFETGDARQLRHHFDVPVIELSSILLHRRAVHDQ